MNNRILSLDEKLQVLEIVRKMKPKFVKKYEQINYNKYEKTKTDFLSQPHIKEKFDQQIIDLISITDDLKKSIKKLLLFMYGYNENHLIYYILSNDWRDILTTYKAKENSFKNVFYGWKYNNCKYENLSKDDKVIVDLFLKCEKLKSLLESKYYIFVINDNIKDLYNRDFISDLSNFYCVSRMFGEEYNDYIKDNYKKIDIEALWNRFEYHLLKCETYMELDGYLGKYLTPDWGNINKLDIKL